MTKFEINDQLRFFRTTGIIPYVKKKVNFIASFYDNI